MYRTIHIGHRRVGVVLQNLAVLRPFELVQQLRTQCYIEVLLYSICYVDENRVFSRVMSFTRLFES